MKYFTIEELSRSEKAASLKIDNRPGAEEVKHLTALVDNVLDPLREHYGKSIRVNSGYRCERLNKAVGGAAKSHHVGGYAADITGGSKAENKKLYDLVLAKGLKFTQLINENDFTWVHVSYVPDNLKMQCLKL